MAQGEKVVGEGLLLRLLSAVLAKCGTMKEVMNYRITKIEDNIYYRTSLEGEVYTSGTTIPVFFCTVCGRESELFFSHCSHKPELPEAIDPKTTKRRFRFLDLGKLFVTRKNQ